jgi:signal transduction histidine kinase
MTTLSLMQNLTMALESATDPAELQEQLLDGLIDEFGAERAVVATYNMDVDGLTGWLARGGAEPAERGHAIRLPVDWAATRGDERHTNGHADLDPVTAALVYSEIIHIRDGRAPTTNSTLNGCLSLGTCYTVFPMIMRQQPIGVLLAAWPPGVTPTGAQAATLEMVVRHASVVLGSLRMCIGRAQQTAILEERGRIAADIHDTVSQSLFGLAYGLNACTQMLPDEPEQVALVKQQLREMQPLVFEALQQVRSVIINMVPEDLNRAYFVNALHKQLSALSLGRPLEFSAEVTPEFDRWPQEFRQQLMLITHEGIANIARHAEAHHASVRLQACRTCILLTVEDDGVGFDPPKVARVPGVGLDGMRKRVETLGGQLEIESIPGQGTRLQAQLPLPCQTATA